MGVIQDSSQGVYPTVLQSTTILRDIPACFKGLCYPPLCYASFLLFFLSVTLPFCYSSFLLFFLSVILSCCFFSFLILPFYIYSVTRKCPTKFSSMTFHDISDRLSFFIDIMTSFDVPDDIWCCLGCEVFGSQQGLRKLAAQGQQFGQLLSFSQISQRQPENCIHTWGFWPPVRPHYLRGRCRGEWLRARAGTTGAGAGGRSEDKMSKEIL